MRFTLLTLLLGSTALLQAQFSGPNSSTYNPKTNKYYICNNYGKNIVSIDANNNKATFISGLTSPNNILYAGLPIGEGYIVLDSNEIKGYDSVGDYVATFSTTGAKKLYDAVFDAASGALYISDIDRGVVYKTTFGPPPFYFPTTSIFSKPYRRPSAMVLQKSLNRILYVEDTLGGNLMAISLSNGSFAQIKSLGMDNLVGLAEDGQGNLYISSQGAKAIYQLNRYYAGSPVKLLTEPMPGDLLVNIDKDQWVYTCIKCGTVFTPALHSFGPAIDVEACPEASFTAYKDIVLKNIGTYEPGNSFIMEMSNSVGSFASPKTLATLNDTLIPDSMVGKIPANTTASVGYKYRWRSTKPAIIGGSAKLTVGGIPKISAASADTIQACIGASIELGSANPKAGVNYQWQPANALDTPTNATVTHLVDTAIRISVVATSDFGCKAEASVWVQPVSKPNVGPWQDTVQACVNNPITLGSHGIGGIEYSWSPSGVLNDHTLAQPIFSADMSRNFTLIATGIGGCSDTLEQYVTVHELPQISLTYDSLSVCPGDTFTNTLQSNVSLLSTTWASLKGADTLSSNTISFSGADAPGYLVSVVDTYGCRASDIFRITAKPLELPGIVKLNDSTLGISIALTAIQWHLEKALLGTDTTQKITAKGRYKVCGTNQYGCEVCSDTASFEPIQNNNSIHEFSTECALYPQPASDVIHLNCNNHVYGQWQLFESSGKRIKVGSGTEIEISELKNGIYFLRLENGASFTVIK